MTVYVCPHCGYAHEPALPIVAISHPCPKRAGRDRRVLLRPQDGPRMPSEPLRGPQERRQGVSAP